MKSELFESELFEEAWKQNRHEWESTRCLAQAMYLAGEQDQQSKIDELQKRVDAALKMISINRGFAWGSVSISQLEQALKGEGCQ